MPITLFHSAVSVLFFPYSTAYIELSGVRVAQHLEEHFMLKIISTAAVMALTLATPLQAAVLSPAPVSADPVVETVGSRLSGAARLQRLFRPHFKYDNPIIQSVRDATGDPNITVLDQRFGDRYQTYQCPYYFLRKDYRVLKCQ